jgi:hypothetical protein
MISDPILDRIARGDGLEGYKDKAPKGFRPAVVLVKLNSPFQELALFLD